MNFLKLAIKRTPHFGVQYSRALALNFGGVWMTAPAPPKTIFF